MTAKTLTIERGAEIDDETRRKFLAHYALPGETVRPTKSRFAGETVADVQARLERFGAGPFLVRETHVHDVERGTARISYAFEGREGLHNAHLFHDDGEPIHGYGVLIVSEGTPWFVELDGVSDAPKALGEPIELERSMPRSARYAFGVADGVVAQEPGQFAYATDEAFMESLETEPLSGEFSMSRQDDGKVVLVYQSFITDSIAADREAALGAIAIATNAPTP